MSRVSKAHAAPASAAPTPAPWMRINEPSHPLEHAADRLADRALSQPAPHGDRPSLVRASGSAPASPPWLGPGRPLDPMVRQDFEQRFEHDFSRVRVHTDERAAESARSIGALAYTAGSDIAFAPGAYAPHTTHGRSLLGHELAHTVQSDRGLAPDRIQPRRVPSGTAVNDALPPAADTVGVMHARTGLSRLLADAWSELSAADQATVRTAAAALGITFTNAVNLRAALNVATRAQLVSFTAEIRRVSPTAELGDPLLINSGPRPATADAANIGILRSHADAVFTVLAGTTRDADITQVFGAANLATVKSNYAAAKARMNTLVTTGKVVTDRSGYNAEVGLGGLSGVNQISVSPETIDHPSDNESIITFIHESMHTAGRSIDDTAGYIDTIGTAEFLSMTEADKLVTAAHYEVVPRRIRGAAHQFAGSTFVPAGTTSGGVTMAPLTSQQQAMNNASNDMREAWTAGLHMHEFWVRLFRTPTEWTTLDLSIDFGAPAGTHFVDCMPFWSKVEMLTVHTRLSAINPAGAPAVRPVTTIDIALSEMVTRKLMQAMFAMPRTSAQVTALEAGATPAERTAAAASASVEKDLIIKLVLRDRIGQITGSLARDIQVVARMARGSRGAYADYVQSRSPSSFP